MTLKILRHAFHIMTVVSVAACAGATARTAPAPVHDAEEAAALARMDTIRAVLLKQAAFVDFGGMGGCDEGALRTFPGDSAPAVAQKNAELVNTMERMIVAWGLDTPLDSAPARALITTLVSWEADASRPRWDVLSGETRKAIAAGLGGTYENADSGKCLPLQADTMTFIFPANVSSVKVPPGVRARVMATDSTLNQLREQFIAAHRGDPEAIFAYTRIRTAVVWNHWGIVSVKRPIEKGGIVQLGGAGGASYIFRRVSGEWRLFLISRTWG